MMTITKVIIIIIKTITEKPYTCNTSCTQLMGVPGHLLRVAIPSFSPLPRSPTTMGLRLGLAQV